MKPSARKRFSLIFWSCILLFLLFVATFPRWISYFYPQPHKNLVFSAAYEYDVDPYLVFAVIRAESRYQEGAHSVAGARGLMQIMPDTAVWIAQQQGIAGFETEQLYDPEVNIRFGCWYLANLSREFDGRLPLIVAAYNAGRGRVKEWVVQEQWNGEAVSVQDIPYGETRSYVENVLKNYYAYRAIYT